MHQPFSFLQYDKEEGGGLTGVNSSSSLPSPSAATTFCLLRSSLSLARLVRLSIVGVASLSVVSADDRVLAGLTRYLAPGILLEGMTPGRAKELCLSSLSSDCMMGG